MINEYLRSAALMLVLLNPFLVIVYLIDIVQKVTMKQFTGILLRAGIIASLVLSVFAVLGDAVFTRVLQADFASFQIFGGIIFLIIGLQFVFQGPRAIEMLRGESQHVAGAIAMPLLIGPGTISASVLIGERHQPLVASILISIIVFFTLAILLLLKRIHDQVKTKREMLIERYIEIAGRITALVIGTISVNMIKKGIQSCL